MSLIWAPKAAIKAAATVDTQVGRIVDAARNKGGALLITADHGNLEKMWDDATAAPHTAHTNNPVPVILVDDARKEVTLKSGGSLRDVAPTLLEILGIPVPAEMDGSSLIEM